MPDYKQLQLDINVLRDALDNIKQWSDANERCLTFEIDEISHQIQLIEDSLWRFEEVKE